MNKDLRKIITDRSKDANGIPIFPARALVKRIGDDANITRISGEKLTPRNIQRRMKKVVEQAGDVDVIFAGCKYYITYLKTLVGVGETLKYAEDDDHLLTCLLFGDIEVVLDGGANGQMPENTMYVLTKADVEGLLRRSTTDYEGHLEKIKQVAEKYGINWEEIR